MNPDPRRLEVLFEAALAVRAAAGWMIDRRFVFADRNLLFNGDGVASFQLSLNGTF